MLGQSSMRRADRAKLGSTLQRIIDSRSRQGVKVRTVEIKDVELPPSMQRDGTAAEAEQAPGQIIHAGRFDSAASSQKLALIATQPTHCSCATCEPE